MDTFMDKLAQKLNAQEMIKANSAADAEEMDQLKNQLREYDECLAQMQQANKELRAVNHAMETLMSETIAPEVTEAFRGKRSCHSQDAAGEYGKAAGAADRNIPQSWRRSDRTRKNWRNCANIWMRNWTEVMRTSIRSV